MRSATKKKTGKDKAYLEWLHTLPCVVCVLNKIGRRDVEDDSEVAVEIALINADIHTIEGQTTPTEAAHVGDRGLSQKCPDNEAIPLCRLHHRDGRDSAHRLGKRFWEHHGLDKETLIATLQTEFEGR